MKKLIVLGTLIALTYTVKAQAITHEKWTALLEKYVTNDGVVNYKGFKAEEAKLQEYLDLLTGNTPKEGWTEKEKVAYWTNVYNAFTVKLIVDNYPLKSIRNIKGASSPWDLKFIEFGNKKISLNDVEHGILRKKYFDPRVHFAVNCASFSCPILLNRAFEAATLDADMDMLAEKFINDPKRNIITSSKLELSQIFEWYKDDFTKNGSLLDYIKKYSKTQIEPKAKIKFITYNWELNE